MHASILKPCSWFLPDLVPRAETCPKNLRSSSPPLCSADVIVKTALTLLEIEDGIYILLVIGYNLTHNINTLSELLMCKL